MWAAVCDALGVGPFKTELAALAFIARQPDAKDWRAIYISWPGRWSN